MKKKIMIDLDDVIVNQEGWLNAINTYLNTNYVIDDVEGYYIQDLVPKDKMDDYVKFFKNQNVYSSCGINDDCYEVLKELNDKYEVYICSAYVYRDDTSYSGDFLKYKYDFLTENFPFLDPKRIIFADDKSVINCDIKIDDKISNLDNTETKILYTCYHNKDVSDIELKNKNIIRVNGWNDIRKILLNE